MKKIINGKKYDTNTAAKVWINESNLPSNDFKYWCETLYKKVTGEFFLVSEGGPMTQFGKWEGNSGGYGETLIPLTLVEAQGWTEENACGETYERIFGEVGE